MVVIEFKPDKLINWLQNWLKRLKPTDFKPLNDEIIPTNKPIKAFEFESPPLDLRYL